MSTEIPPTDDVLRNLAKEMMGLFMDYMEPENRVSVLNNISDALTELIIEYSAPTLSVNDRGEGSLNSGQDINPSGNSAGN